MTFLHPVSIERAHAVTALLRDLGRDVPARDVALAEGCPIPTPVSYHEFSGEVVYRYKANDDLHHKQVRKALDDAVALGLAARVRGDRRGDRGLWRYSAIVTT